MGAFLQITEYPEEVNRARALAGCVLGLSMAVAAGCGAARGIPNKVSPDEYAVYADFLRARFAKKPPDNLYLTWTTFIFDPMEKCGRAVEKGQVDRALALQLQALGEAQYVLRWEPLVPEFRIPWAFQVAGEYWPAPVPSFRRVGFSRVAFDAKRTVAYFAYSDACGGLCGDGGAVVARREGGGPWRFERTDCLWVY